MDRYTHNNIGGFGHWECHKNANTLAHESVVCLTDAIWHALSLVTKAEVHCSCQSQLIQAVFPCRLWLCTGYLMP